MRRLINALVVGLVGCAMAATSVDAQQIVVQHAVVSEEQFERWMFDSARDESGCRARLQATLNNKIAGLDRQFQLDDSQKEKLRLAANGDINRFFDRVALARDFYMEKRNDQNGVNEIFQHIQPLRQELTGDFFDDASFFQKVLRATLDASQLETLHELERQERIARFRRLVQQTVLAAESEVPMLAEQRQAFEELLRKHGKPPLHSSNYDHYVMMYYASQIPEKELAVVFDDPQVKALARHFQQGRALQQFLEQQGLLDPAEIALEEKQRVAP